MPDNDVAGLRNGNREWKKIVEKLKCRVCTKFVDKIRGRKNFSDKWICGADSVRTSNVRDHAHNDQHTHAMSLLKKERAEASGLAPASYAPMSRLSWSDMELMRDIIFMLSTHGWEKALEEDNDMAAIDRLVQRFAIPLQGAAVDTEEVVKEFREMISYATQYIALSVLDYHSVWWRLFHAPCSSEWANILALAELLFSLPASNGKLERVFSLLGVIKVNKRSLLSNETLDDLLLLNSDKIPLDKFNPNPAIDLWWSAKARRPSQKSRKLYKPRKSDQPSTSTVDPEESEPDDALRDWDDIVQSSEDD